MTQDKTPLEASCEYCSYSLTDKQLSKLEPVSNWIKYKEENARLRQALDFYQDIRNYQQLEAWPILIDKGSRAREALNPVNKE